jgi:hypothetical protein
MITTADVQQELDATHTNTDIENPHQQILKLHGELLTRKSVPAQDSLSWASHPHHDAVQAQACNMSHLIQL